LKGTHLGSGVVSSDRTKDGETVRRECVDFGRPFLGVYGLGGQGDNGEEGDGELHVSTEPRDQNYEVHKV
jgi:hypothetical protein